MSEQTFTELEKKRENRKLQKPAYLPWILIAVLAVVLIVATVIAVSLSGPQDSGTTDTEGQTSEPSTEASTAPPSFENVYLSLSSPAENQFFTMERTVVFEGLSDPNESLTVNGTEITRDEKGAFRYEYTLAYGANTVELVHKGETFTYAIDHRYVVANYGPQQATAYGSGAVATFYVIARENSTVTAAFCNQTIAFQPVEDRPGYEIPDGCRLFEGTYLLPGGNPQTLNLGKAVVTAVCDGTEEIYELGEVVVQHTSEIKTSDPSVTPTGGKYIDVGSGYIAEVIIYSAETFNGLTNDDFSHTTNIYLPKGTVDYISNEVVTSSGGMTYHVMRSGQRIYLDKRNTPITTKTRVINRYIGTLPDHNEIGFVSMVNEGRHTVLTLDCLWKAPFYFDLLPQKYANPDGGAGRNYDITAFTATHVDITFCYATVFTGDVVIPENPIFQSAELIKQESDHILRLHFKETGKFYGWDAYYNEQGQLCFRFLNPAKITVADNAYGADLTGVKILIDVGHGGKDPGTVQYLNGVEVQEEERNRAVAFAVKAELESMGATVIMNRTEDVTLTVDNRISQLKAEAPDYTLCIHHNSMGTLKEHNGYVGFWYTPFSKQASEKILLRTAATGIYEKSMLNWYYYFMCRQTVCPVVLTENGFMSNDAELAKILDPEVTTQKAQAIAQGVADWFLMINGLA